MATQSVLTLTPGGKPLAAALGFGAAAVIVDNLTSSYVRLPDVGIDVPPWVVSRVVTLVPPTNKARASLVATTPAVAGPPVPTSQATLTWTEQALPADPGHLLQQGAYSQQTVIGTLTAAANQTSNQTLPVPAGTMSIGYLVWSDTGHDTPSTVTIHGHQSSHEYFAGNVLNDIGGPQWFPFASSDTSIDVSMTAAAASASKIDVLATPLVEVLDVQQTFSTVLDVQLTNSGASALAVDNPSTGVFQLIATQNGATPAPWQAAKAVKEFEISLAAGASGTIVAANVGVTVYLHSLWYWLLSAVANSKYRVKDGAGGTTIVGVATNLGTAPTPIDLKGAPLASGKGVVLQNDGTVAGDFMIGTLAYSQG